MIEEVWKDILDFDGLYKGYYQISNLGRVRSLDRVDSLGRKQIGCILIGSNSWNGYRQVSLKRNSKSKTFRVHRLVANAFLENNDNKPQVNHKDEDKHNNNVKNLEWVTIKENANYGTRNERLAKSQSKPIKVIYQDDTYEIWESASKFAREYGNGVKRSNIVQVLSGDKKTHRGLRFEYVD